MVKGDAFDAHAVTAAIAGQEAVISCLSSSAPMKKSTEVQRMTANIVQGMLSAGIDRIAYCASAGVQGELDGAIGKAVAWMLRHPLEDHRAAIQLINAAHLDATIARPMSLNNEAFSQEYRESFEGVPGRRAIPRASVADFLVKAIEQPERYSHTSVGLSL